MNEHVEKDIRFCLICRKEMVLKKSKYGTFFGCSNYPKYMGRINADKKIKLQQLELIKQMKLCRT